MKVRLLVLALSFIVLASVQVWAHHSFAATYFEDKSVTIEGKLVQFQFRNPHSFIQLEVKDDKGQIQRWAVEWGGAGQLGSQGVTNQTLQAGDIVTISGNPGRNPEDHRVRMVSLRRKSDGFGWGQRPGETFN
jgi:lysyl-tRNA synthetase class II